MPLQAHLLNAHAPLFYHQHETGKVVFLSNRCSASPCYSLTSRFGHYGAANTLSLRGNHSLNVGDFPSPAASSTKISRMCLLRAARRRHLSIAPLNTPGERSDWQTGRQADSVAGPQLCSCVTPLPESVIAARPASQDDESPVPTRLVICSFGHVG